MDLVPVILSSIEQYYSERVGCVVLVDGIKQGINLGLNFTPSKIKFGELEVKGIKVYYPDKCKVYGQEFQQIKICEDEVGKVTKLSDLLTHFLFFISSSAGGEESESVYTAGEINEMIRKYYKARGFSSVDFDSQFVLPKL